MSVAIYWALPHALDTASGPFHDRIAALPHATDLEGDLTALADDYLRAVQLRQLVISEANRLPSLARLYYDHAPTRTLAALAEGFVSCTTGASCTRHTQSWPLSISPS